MRFESVRGDQGYFVAESVGAGVEVIEIFEKTEGDLIGLLASGQQGYDDSCRLSITLGMHVLEERLAALGEEFDGNVEGVVVEIRLR